VSVADPSTDIAARLRAARHEQGLAIEELARELRNPVSVLEVIERGEWPRLGAPVFVRHLVGRYAARLGVDVDLEAVARTVDAPVLRSQVPASRLGRFADFSARHVAYVAGTLLVVPTVYALLSLGAGGPADVRPLDPVAVAMPAAAPPDAAGPAQPSTLAAAATPAVAVAPTSATPVSASLAGPASAPARELELRFRGESWIEVLGTDGRSLRQMLAVEGDVLRFSAADVGRVTVGNVAATDVWLDGSPVNLDAVRAANVARFALSSDGSIEAVAR
jgi:cytoskeleton protein RodZ